MKGIDIGKIIILNYFFSYEANPNYVQLFEEN